MRWNRGPVCAARAVVPVAAFALACAGAATPHPPAGGKACADCHSSITQKKALHSPVKDGMCEACHEIPAKGGAATLTDKKESLCYLCHEKEKFNTGNVHGPVAVGACLACHDPHGGENTPFLAATGSTLCFGCHTDAESRFRGAQEMHKPLQTGCTSCHNPHASASKVLLRAEGGALCAKCHAKVIDSASAAQTKHPPVTQERACLNCHDPHASNHRPQLRADGLTTCLGCHDRSMNGRGGQLADMKKLLAENKDHHGPIRDKDCTGCHAPHGSNNFRLLGEPYPKEFYAAYREEAFALCFQCHDSALTRDEKSTTLTSFRDGDRNLHFLHVNKSPKGRTCRACHETHAASRPKHIRNAVPFGKWDLPVNYEPTANGGSCAPGCHAPKTYSRPAVSEGRSQ